MKIFSTAQIREYDNYTIQNEPISSLDLMERAAQQLFDTILDKFESSRKFAIVCGRGNNGGEGLAIARLMSYFPFEIQVFLIDEGKPLSPDAQANLNRLPQAIRLVRVSKVEELTIPSDFLILDCLFGTGLNQLPKGIYADSILKINELPNKVVSIDLPSGLLGDMIPDVISSKDIPIIQADYTLPIQQPKLSFFFAESERFVGKWEVVDIGLSSNYYEQTKTNFHTIDKELVQSYYHKRMKFSHKGTFGHSLIIAGSEGKVGAAVLASKSCLKSGAGLVTTCISKGFHSIFHTAIPEIMMTEPSSEINWKVYNAIGVGPGLGTESVSKNLIKSVLRFCKSPLVLDADALNCISMDEELLNLLPPNSILTPHTKEFDRLVGASNTTFERFQKQIQFAQNQNVIIVLKGAYTSVALPDGNVYFNTTGNPGMATAGSGDVLTGVLTGLLAQGYQPKEAALMGVFLHGLAGDLALETESEESLIAFDVICNLGRAFKLLYRC